MPQYAVLVIVGLNIKTVATFDATDNDDALLKGPAFVPAEHRDNLLGFHAVRSAAPKVEDPISNIETDPKK